MGTIDDYLKSKSKKKYYCLGCFQHAKEKHFLITLKDGMGKVYQCPNCKFMSADWVIERDFEKREKEVFRKMGIFK